MLALCLSGCTVLDIFIINVSPILTQDNTETTDDSKEIGTVNQDNIDQEILFILLRATNNKHRKRYI